MELGYRIVDSTVPVKRLAVGIMKNPGSKRAALQERAKLMRLTLCLARLPDGVAASRSQLEGHSAPPCISQYTLRQSSPCRCSPVAIPRQLRDHPFNCLLPICTMNGVCRSLGNATYAITKDRAGPPRSWSPSKELSPSPSTGIATRGLFIFKDCKPSPPGARPSSTNSSPTTTPPPLCRKIVPPPEWEDVLDMPPDILPHPATKGVKHVNTRDAL
jgi:hypothetical protein